MLLCEIFKVCKTVNTSAWNGKDSRNVDALTGETDGRGDLPPRSDAPLRAAIVVQRHVIKHWVSVNALDQFLSHGH